MFSVKELDLLISGLDAIKKSETSDSALLSLLSIGFSKSEADAKARMEELRLEKKRLQDARAEEELEISILRGKLAGMKLKLLREQPFAGMESIEESGGGG